MTKLTACVWCSKIIPIRDSYDDLRHKAVCSPGCRDAETLFNLYYSDEEINRRAHYRYLTQGERDGENTS